MALRMVALIPHPAGHWTARKAIPADVRAEYRRLYGVGREAILKLAAGTPRARAVAELGQWLAEVETRIERIRAAARGEGQPLTPKNAAALAGLWHSWFIARHAADPKTPRHWAEVQESFIWDILEPHAPKEHHEAFGTHAQDDSWPWLDNPEVLEAIAPAVREWALTTSFLASEGLKLAPDAELLFIAAVRRNYTGACARLENLAGGNYAPDKALESFPVYVRPGAANGMDCWELFASYVAGRKPADSAVTRMRPVFLALKATFPDRGADTVTEDEARAWVGTLVTAERGAETVAKTWISAPNIVFGWAKKHKLIPANPFKEIKIDVPKKVTLREPSFTDAEALSILRASLLIANPTTPMTRAKRWVPWLCAYSGARGGEITQLRGKDVTKAGAVYVMNLTPEAGTIKTNEARVVPIHEHIIEQGFIEAIEALGDGPLFYYPRPAGTEKSEDPTKPKQHPAVKTRQLVGEWVRELGVKDKEVQPNHGWRHLFKQLAERYGISEKASHAITGHRGANEGQKYGPLSIEDKAEVLKRFLRYKV